MHTTIFRLNIILQALSKSAADKKKINKNLLCNAIVYNVILQTIILISYIN